MSAKEPAMYVAPAFRPDTAEAWALVEERAFGAVIVRDGDRMVSSHVPLLVDRSGPVPRVAFHVARANSIHAAIARDPAVLIVVWGADAYVSPDWYVSQDQVPTWNYEAVHLSGTARCLPPDETHAHVEAMSLHFEKRLAPKPVWSTSKMPEQRRDAMLRAIVPISVEITGVEASLKLNQNKTWADRVEVARMLEWRGDWAARGMAEAMKRSL